MAQICDDAQMPVAIAAAQLQWLACIVRHGERQGLQAAEFDGATITRHIQQMRVGFPSFIADCQPSTLAHPERC